MARRSPALDALRTHIIASGGAFLRNVRWTPGVTCPTCAGVLSPGYDMCRPCAARANQPGLADDLGFVTYAAAGSQAGRTMYAYKANGPTSHLLVSSLLTYATVAHWDCIARRTGHHPDGWAYVPSLAGQPGTHPVARIASRFLGNVPSVPIQATPTTKTPRAFDPAHFTVPATSARHVLLLDDTWTTGGHLQSVSAALKAIGVEHVTGLVVARWLDPRWAATRSFIDGLPANL